MYRFKEKRPRGRPSHYSGSEAVSTSPYFLSSLTREWYQWPLIPRAVTRLCAKFSLLLIVVGVFLLYLRSRVFYGFRGEASDAQFGRSFLLGAIPFMPSNGLPNTFANYKHFGEKCNISSDDIHRSYAPVCSDRTSMLTAMSSGGRAGRDAPYIPRSCDMEWYTTEEVCKILGRFTQVVLIGDSMLRHVIGALNIILREDLGYGGVTDWNFDARERQENRTSAQFRDISLMRANRERCFCNDQFDVTDCSVQGIYKTEDVMEHDPSSLACPRLLPGWSTDLRSSFTQVLHALKETFDDANESIVEQMVRYPIEKAELERLEMAVDKNPNSRKAFILGHGLWNDLEIDKSKAWMDTVLKVIDSKLRLRMRLRTLRHGRNLPILLMTPNAAGDKKPDEYLITQGNKALVHFERAMAREAAKLRVDHLGTWNMSIQANLYDGVHMDLRGNLLKAMMVVNWLNLLEE